MVTITTTKNVDRSHWQQTRKPHPFSAGAEALANYIFRDEQEFSAPLFRSFLPLQQRTSDSLLNDLINLELRSDFNVSIFRLNKIKSDEMDE